MRTVPRIFFGIHAFPGLAPDWNAPRMIHFWTYIATHHIPDVKAKGTVVLITIIAENVLHEFSIL
jgi:hypothetical protein